MARKGNQQKRVPDQISAKSKSKDTVLKEVLDGEQTADVKRASLAGDGQKKNSDTLRKDEQIDSMGIRPAVHVNGTSGESVEKLNEVGTSMSHAGNKSVIGTSGCSVSGAYTETITDKMHLYRQLVLETLSKFALSILRMSCGWMERQRPFFLSVANKVQRIRDYARWKVAQATPIVLDWLLYAGSTVIIVWILWLACAYRGIVSMLQFGTTSFLTILWFSILSSLAMVGSFKFLLLVTIAAVIGFLVGFIISLLIIAVSGAVLLWLYGSFWTTSSVIIIAGLAYILSSDRLALLITTVYSVYCAWAYVGWLGLLLGFNLAFISSDLLIKFVKVNIYEQRNKTFEQTNGFHADRSFSTGEADIGSGDAADRSAGVASTSGADSDFTSEDEVIRLLNSTDHYSVLGLSRYQQVDVSVLKREYRKKAMLVHPDKNMGNEKAAEAFKKLQNAYEVLLDSVKRQMYDDELKREELLNYFCRSQNTSQKNGRRGFSRNGFTRSEGEGEDPFAESRRIACKKCGNFHVWIQTKKSKSKARWCQDCNDFHQAKDGDGWVEQSSQSLFFGILHKVEFPVAYVCADGIVYDATEWYVCQGMRCPANSHKASFHVNTSLTKNNSGKGSASSHKGGETMEENMTEEEFFEWLQNAMRSGMFENYEGGVPNDGSQTSARSRSKSSPNSAGAASSSKRKKKGKKQW